VSSHRTKIIAYIMIQGIILGLIILVCAWLVASDIVELKRKDVGIERINELQASEISALKTKLEAIESHLDERIKIATLPSKDGANGSNGANGTDGSDGSNGRDGASAYEVWLAQGNQGSEQDFLASLRGEDGIAREIELGRDPLTGEIKYWRPAGTDLWLLIEVIDGLL